MISLEECEAVLNQKEKKYNQAQVKNIRAFLYQMARIQDELIEKRLEGKKSRPLHQSID